MNTVSEAARSPLLPLTIRELIDRRVADDPGFVYCRFGEQALTLGELDRRINRFANGLLAKSITARGQELVVGTLSDGWLRIPVEGRATRQEVDGRATRQELDEGGEVRRVFSVGEDLYLLRPGRLDVLRAGRLAKAITKCYLNYQRQLKTNRNKTGEWRYSF